MVSFLREIHHLQRPNVATATDAMEKKNSFRQIWSVGLLKVAIDWARLRWWLQMFDKQLNIGSSHSLKYKTEDLSLDSEALSDA